MSLSKDALRDISVGEGLAERKDAMHRHLVALAFVALPLAAALTMLEARIAAQPPTPPAPPALPAPLPCPRRACNSTPSTGRPTRAPTSISSPAAAGWRRTRSPPIARAGAASTSCRSATTRRCDEILEAAAAGRDPATEEDRRLLRLVHGRDRDRREGRRAARPDARRRSRRSSSANALAPLVAELHTIGVNAVLQLRRRGRLQGRVDRDGDRRPGRPGPARPRLLLQGRREIGGAADAVRRARREDVGAARRPAGPGGRGGAARDGDRDGAREGRARRRVAPRPEQDLPQAVARPSCRR